MLRHQEAEKEEVGGASEAETAKVLISNAKPAGERISRMRRSVASQPPSLISRHSEHLVVAG
jgi:hypothetical protein